MAGADQRGLRQQEITMQRVLVTLSFLALSGAAMANGIYPTTLSPEERERHEFLDVQRGIRSGVAPTVPSEMIGASREFGRPVKPSPSEARNIAPNESAGGNF
ncbi:hypothetical protein [Phreatobacter cathodiphilus]|nr:hypothetical protein [Phreatobacter cathodiphilus]